MDKKSGVYYELTDNSLRVGGSSPFAGIVPMYTVKGDLGKLIKVTARDYKEKLGFDLDYNPNYYGLDRMLASVASLEVLRCNVGSTVAYKIWGSDGVPVEATDFSSADEVAFNAGNNSFWVSCNSSGTWGNNISVYFTRREDSSIDSYIYTLHCYSVTSGVASLIGDYDFSLSEDSDLYYQKVSFGDFVFGINGDILSDPAFFEVPSNLLNESYTLFPGSNGSELSDPLSISSFFSAIDGSSANVVVMNGFVSLPLSDKPLLKSIGSYCGKQDRSVFFDAPFTKDPVTGILRANDDLFSWSQSLLDDSVGQYWQVASVPDQVKVNGKLILIQPSVHLFLIYAKMFATYGHVNYPPAGESYGSVSVNSLVENDFYLHGDALKTNRINYLTSYSSGVCMWEYRTLYSKGNSDLSYANTPFILRDLSGRLTSFLKRFVFRYSTPVDLLNIHSGLDSILGSFLRRFFLVNYTLRVPTFEEAQAAGRELDIEIEVAVINSADVITLKVTLQNAANLRAA